MTRQDSLPIVRIQCHKPQLDFPIRSRNALLPHSTVRQTKIAALQALHATGFGT